MLFKLSLNPNELNSLPLELLELIFDYLDLQSKIRCRQICKKFKWIVDNHLKFKNLFIAKTKSDNYYFEKWFDTHNYFDCSNLVLELNLTDKFFKYSNLILNNQVKNLVVYSLNTLDLIRILNVYNKIEKLNITCLNDQEGDLIINLSNLKCLELCSSRRKKINFNLPKLKRLATEFGNQAFPFEYEFKYPETIEFGKFNRYYPLIERFVNLKILLCYEFDNEFAVERIESNFLSKFSKLEELHLNEPEMLNEFNRQRTRFNLYRLKIYLYGLNLGKLKNYDDCNYNLSRRKMELYIENEDKLANCIPFNDFTFKYELIESFSKLPNNFFKRFKQLDSIKLTKPIDDLDKFINFTLKFGRVSYVELDYVVFNRKLLYRLSIACPYLIQLAFINRTKMINFTENDLNKFFNFKNLNHLHLEKQPLECDFVKKLFMNLKKLTSLNFSIQSKEITLFNKENNEFELINYELDQAINFKNLNSISFDSIKCTKKRSHFILRRLIIIVIIIYLFFNLYSLF